MTSDAAAKALSSVGLLTFLTAGADLPRERDLLNKDWAASSAGALMQVKAAGRFP